MKGVMKMAHVQKNTRMATGHLFDHYGRNAEEEKYKYLYRSNDSIDPSKTYLNYNLAPNGESQEERLNKRLSEVKVLKRKDVNVMCSWVVTAPKDLDPKQEKDFFKETYEFLKNRYGGEKNVISAYVHKDETTPHLHFAFVPVTIDKKKNIEKVSAKEVITKLDLKSFHEDLQKHLEKANIRCSILNEATREGNKSIEELKRQSATERLQEVTEKASKIVSKAQIQAQVVNDNLIAIQAEYEAKKAYVKEFDRISDVSVMYPAEAKVTEKGLIHKQKFVTVPAELWEAKHISANEKNYLQKVNEELEKKLQEFQTTTSSKNFATLSKHINELEKQNMALNKQNHALTQQLNVSEKNASKIMNRVNKVLSKLPDEIADEFVKAWKIMERNKGWER